MTTSEQQAVPVAQEQESALETAFYLLDTLAGEGLSQTCDDGRTIEADDTVHALCSAFYMEPDVGWYRDLAAQLAPLPCKSGEGAGEALREAVARVIGKHGAEHPWHWDADFDDGEDKTAERLRNDDRATADEVLALTPDATQTREAEGAEPDWAAIRAAVAKAAWPSTGLVDEAMATIRAALNARGGA